MSELASTLSIGQCAALACLFEATAPKPGNVHRGADFEDLSYLDLVTSGMIVGPEFERASSRPVGATILSAIQATAAVCGTNTNLGIVLLIAPLATVPRSITLRAGIQAVLDALTVDDTRQVYEAIRLARPGGLGKVDEADVLATPPQLTLVEAMRLGAERDLVARQYTGGFYEVLQLAAPWLAEGVARESSLCDAIVQTHLRLLSTLGDSLIERKCGPAVAREAADRAGSVLSVGEPGDGGYQRALADFDFWLRADGHRRNPGTTADMVAAGLFVLLREGTIAAPWRFYPGDRRG